jgi:hypothetical protein
MFSNINTKLQNKVIKGLKEKAPSALKFCRVSATDEAGINALLVHWVLVDRKRKPRLPK